MKRIVFPKVFIILAMVFALPISLISTTPIARAQPTSDDYYWLVASDGGVFSFGGAGYYGSTGNIKLNQPIVGMAPTITGEGYWLVASDGGIFSFGDADFYGSTGAMRLNKPIVAMVPTITSEGYWLVASDGGIFSFGDAQFYGSTGGIKLNKPIIGMTPTQYSEGYWMVASDGGVFSFGDAQFRGAPASDPNTKYDNDKDVPSMRTYIRGISRLPAGGDSGYWAIGSHGQIYGYDVPNINQIYINDTNIVGFVAKPYDGTDPSRGGGWMASATGGIYTTGNAQFRGSLGAIKLNKPIVGIASQVYSTDEYLDYYGIE